MIVTKALRKTGLGMSEEQQERQGGRNSVEGNRQGVTLELSV